MQIPDVGAAIGAEVLAAAEPLEAQIALRFDDRSIAASRRKPPQAAASRRERCPEPGKEGEGVRPHRVPHPTARVGGGRR